MKKINIENYSFIKYSKENIDIVFSTAKGELNFNKTSNKGKENLTNLKAWFHLKDVIYLNQIHSDRICNYKDSLKRDEEGYICDGDAIITKERNIAVGVFTADCVPVIMVDIKNQVIAAVHSGWKGTFSYIVKKTIEKMNREYGTRASDIHVYIGPHNKVCCYEVGEELSNKFMSEEMYKDKDIVKNINLDLQKCIIAQLNICEVPLENIHSTEICTYCNEEFEMYSYRKEEQKEGRMFSFVYINDISETNIPSSISSS